MDCLKPKTFDKNSYMRTYMREYNRKKKMLPTTINDLNGDNMTSEEIKDFWDLWDLIYQQVVSDWEVVKSK